jgi:hypothetical protein
VRLDFKLSAEAAMKRPVALLALIAVSAVPLRADVRVTSTTSLEGAFAAMMPGATPKIVMQIKGTKARADVDVAGQTMSTITDLSSKQVILLNNAQKTAQFLTGGKLPAGMPPMGMPKIDATVTPTGKSQMISGVSCEEFSVSMSMSMGEMMGQGQMPAEAAEMMKTIRLAMNGSMWVAKSGPGVAEYMAFQAAATKGEMLSMMTAIPGLSGSGLDRLMGAFANAGGMPYLTELTMTIQGNDQIAEVMKQQGPIKVTTKVTEVSTAPISDTVFETPADYKVIK